MALLTSFILLRFQPTQPLAHLLQAFGSRALLRCRHFLREAGLSFSFPSKPASGLPSHSLPNHWQNGQQHFTLLFEQDRTAFKEYVGFHLIAIFQKAFGMLQLEVIIMVISLRSKTYFLHVHLHLLCLLFFLTLL